MANFVQATELRRRGARHLAMTGRSGGGRRFGEQGTTHCDPVRGRGRWHVGRCGDRGPAWEEKKRAGPKKNSNFSIYLKKF
jgi:hypothetical protein